jgi:flagellar biosynthesis/type III secretory pathway protein FliH
VSSEPAVAAYAFTQLDAPPTVGEIADALAAVQREADQIRERARAAGHAEGYAAGLAEAREQAAPALAALRDLGGEFEALRERVISELEQDALAMAFELCEQIMAGAVSVQPERVLDVARHALRHLSDRRQVTLVVNPDDLALLNESAVALVSELGGIEHLAVQADRRVGRGGAIARTEAGEIDAGLHVQLTRARELVAEDLAEALPDAPALLESPALAQDA